MDTIQSFIEQSAGSLGVPAGNVQKLTGGLLGLIKQEASDEDGEEFIAKIPGAEALLGQSAKAAEASAGGGVLGGLMSSAGSLMGGSAGSALSVMGLFKQADLGTDQAGSLVSMFFDFARSKAGSELVGRILGQIPELGKLVG